LDNSLDPLPFHVMIATLGFAENTMDSDLVAALEFLRKRFPQANEWPERLGFVYFQKGDPARALTVLGPLLRPDANGLRPESFILAAESARVEGKVDMAIRILDAANAVYPKTLSVLNNLVYTLAQRPATLGRARSLLPELLKLDSDSFVVRDTVAMVCFRSGQVDEAESHILRALQAVDDKDYAALEVRMNAADILLAKGRVDVARNMIEQILKNPKCPKPVELRGRELMKLVAQAPLKGDLANATRLFQARKYEEALAILKRILLDPSCDGDVEKDATSLLRRVAEERAQKQ
jgi:tetratricopeptide (TPR) repeat protein